MKEDAGTIVPYEEEWIGEHQFRAYQLSLQQWANLTEHLAQMLGGPFATALRGGNIDLGVLADGDVVALALASVMERLTAQNLLGLLNFAIGKKGQAGSLRLGLDDGNFKPRKVDQWHLHFQRNMAELAPAMKLFLVAQYSDFIDGLKACKPEQTDEPDDQEESTPQDSTASQST
jgi:hypothetical protein